MSTQNSSIGRSMTPEAVLKEVNLQITPVRIATMQLFETIDQPIDAQFLIQNLSTDRVTVFRTLNTFVAKGILRKVEFGEGKARYELNAQEHHHLICQNCGKIEDIPHFNVPSVENDIQSKRGFLVTSHNVEYFGICRNCQK